MSRKIRKMEHTGEHARRKKYQEEIEKIYRVTGKLRGLSRNSCISYQQLRKRNNREKTKWGKEKV